MKLELLVAEKNADTQTDTQDSCFISIHMTRVPWWWWGVRASDGGSSGVCAGGRLW